MKTRQAAEKIERETTEKTAEKAARAMGRIGDNIGKGKNNVHMLVLWL